MSDAEQESLKEGPSEIREESPADSIGMVVAGRYRILGQLAKGGMGSVYLAEQITLQRKVAVKIVENPGRSMGKRFRREAASLADVSHPAIVEILDFDTMVDEATTRGCLVMAFIDGLNLADYLGQQPERRVDPAEVRVLMLPIVSALVELHSKSIIHRDIKPDNIVRFLRADGRPGVKLVDFGLARRRADCGITGAGYLLGTPPYMSMEVMTGEEHTPLADIYSLGATMFELLTGAPPFGRGTVPEIAMRAYQQEAQFPPELAQTAMGVLVGRMLARDPGDRPHSLSVLRSLEQMRDPRAAAETLDRSQRTTIPLEKVVVPSVQTDSELAEQDHANLARADAGRRVWLLVLVFSIISAILGGGLVALLT